MEYDEAALELHKEKKGKFATASKVPVKTKEDLSIAYTPGVAAPCREIAEDPSKSFVYTSRGNVVAVISDGSAVLGLGDIGPEAAMPVMEGKAILFKEFANIDAIPIVLGTKDEKEIITIITALAPSFGGINLEDISAPRCFAIEAALQGLGIPVLHDDQHGTAVVVLAALINALTVVGKRIEEVAIVIGGAGAAGAAITNLLHTLSPKSLSVLDSKGVLCPGRTGMNPVKEGLAAMREAKVCLPIEEVFKGADVFIGVARPGLVTEEHIASMNNPIVMSMANPIPEVMPDVAKRAGAAVIATGRSDYPNQINNVLAFPGIFRGALDCRATRITEGMKVAAAHAIAALTPEPTAEEIIVSPLDERVVSAVAKAVAEAARKSGVTSTSR